MSSMYRGSALRSSVNTSYIKQREKKANYCVFGHMDIRNTRACHTVECRKYTFARGRLRAPSQLLTFLGCLWLFVEPQHLAFSTNWKFQENIVTCIILTKTKRRLRLGERHKLQVTSSKSCRDIFFSARV